MSLFERDPASALALFACWQRHPDLTALSADTTASLDALVQRGDAALAGQPRAREAFLSILRGAEVARTLQRMHLHGVLGAYLPAFAKVTGRMQYDLFHVYTVDQHTLNVVRNVDRIAAGKAPEFPQATAVFEGLRKPELLYLAVLFHDIAKGRGGDHSNWAPPTPPPSAASTASARPTSTWSPGWSASTCCCRSPRRSRTSPIRP